MSSTSLYSFNKDTNPEELILPLPSSSYFGSLPKKYFETPSSLTNRHSVFANSSNIYWVVPLPSTSHHQDFTFVSRGSQMIPIQLHLPLLLENGGQPKVYIMILSNPEKLQEIDLILVQGVEGFFANSICQADLPGRNWDVKHLNWICQCLENVKHILPHGGLMMIYHGTK